MEGDGCERPDRMMVRMADSFRALGEPERLRLLHLLHRRGETPTEALAAQSGQDLDRLTDHLRVLRGAGLVRSEQRGGQMVHALDSYGLLDLMATMNAHFDPRTARSTRARRGLDQRRANGHALAVGGA